MKVKRDVWEDRVFFQFMYMPKMQTITGWWSFPQWRSQEMKVWVIVYTLEYHLIRTKQICRHEPAHENEDCAINTPANCKLRRQNNSQRGTGPRNVKEDLQSVNINCTAVS